MNRRAFLGLAALATFDPERLLWVQGKKLISIPKPSILDPADFDFTYLWISIAARYDLQHDLHLLRQLRRAGRRWDDPT